MMMGLRGMPLLTLLMVPASALVIVKPTVFPSTLNHAIAAFGPQAVGDPAACKADSHDCYPAVTGTIVGLNTDRILYGCSRDELPNKLPKDFIMLARRDNCEFSRKASVAQDAGAGALVVYDSMMGEPLEIMRQVDGPKIVIPSIFITSESGEEILELLTNQDEVIAVINATGNFEMSESDWQLTVLWFLFVAFIAMWIVVLGCFSSAVCRRWCHKSRRQRAVGSLKRRKYKKKSPPAVAGDSKEPERNSDEHDSVPTDFCDPESQYDQESCVICLSEFDDGDSITTLPCGHDYHTECIKPWLLKRSSKCPICKTSFLPKKKKDSAPSSLHSNVETPLLSDPHGNPAQLANEEGASDDSHDGDSDEDDRDFEDGEEEDDNGHFWPASVFGLSPGALVLTAACTTGVGIAVAIVIFLLHSSLP